LQTYLQPKKPQRVFELGWKALSTENSRKPFFWFSRMREVFSIEFGGLRGFFELDEFHEFLRVFANFLHFVSCLISLNSTKTLCPMGSLGLLGFFYYFSHSWKFLLVLEFRIRQWFWTKRLWTHLNDDIFNCKNSSFLAKRCLRFAVLYKSFPICQKILKLEKILDHSFTD
jgi:hypothetical protein